jgi:hypothetical protein
MISFVNGKTEISHNLQELSNCSTDPFIELPLRVAEAFETGLRMGPPKRLVGCDRHGHELAGESPVITPERRECVGKGKGARRNFLDLPEEG